MTDRSSAPKKDSLWKCNEKAPASLGEDNGDGDVECNDEGDRHEVCKLDNSSKCSLKKKRKSLKDKYEELETIKHRYKALYEQMCSAHIASGEKLRELQARYHVTTLVRSNHAQLHRSTQDQNQ